MVVVPFLCSVVFIGYSMFNGDEIRSTTYDVVNHTPIIRSYSSSLVLSNEFWGTS